jgi:hypothetical protein
MALFDESGASWDGSASDDDVELWDEEALGYLLHAFSEFLEEICQAQGKRKCREM